MEYFECFYANINIKTNSLNHSDILVFFSCSCKTVGVSGIRTRAVGIEGKHADHLTITTAQGANCLWSKLNIQQVRDIEMMALPGWWSGISWKTGNDGTCPEDCGRPARSTMSCRRTLLGRKGRRTLLNLSNRTGSIGRRSCLLSRTYAGQICQLNWMIGIW